MSCKEGYITIATMLEDIADAHIPWIVDVFVGSIDTELIALPPPHTIQPCSTPLLVFPLPLTSSSRRPPHLTYQRK